MELAPGHVLVRTGVPEGLAPRVEASGWLAPAEAERAERIRSATERAGFVAARGLLRRVVADVLGETPAAVALGRAESGRPFLEGAAGLQLSVTHTAGLVACGVGRVEALGIDAERRSRRPRSLALARRYFALPEIDALEALPEDERHSHFLGLWTCKEALGKALGRGVAPVLGDPVFALGPEGRVEGGAPGYRHELHALASDHWLAIAARGAVTIAVEPAADDESPGAAIGR